MTPIVRARLATSLFRSTYSPVADLFERAKHADCACRDYCGDVPEHEDPDSACKMLPSPASHQPAVRSKVEFARARIAESQGCQ
jgi:hypothetical protein